MRVFQDDLGGNPLEDAFDRLRETLVYILCSIGEIVGFGSLANILDW
jgi:hypothetical protein